MHTHHCRELAPGLDAKQAAQYLRRTLRPAAAAAKVLTKGIVVAQDTTAARTHVTVLQQKRWHYLVESVMAQQKERNTDDGSGISFDSVKDSFTFNLDEECWQASGSQVHIVGAASHTKHEKQTLGRTSITLLKCGNAHGNWGPTMVLAKGETVDPLFTDEFLVQQGAKPGSTVVMTESAYMTDKAFDDIAVQLCKGIRSVPIVKDHPTWWVMCTADGFHAHKMTVQAQVALLEHRIILVIEEGDTSQVVQPFDRTVAKDGKAEMRGMMAAALRCNVFGESASQWDLILIALHALRAMEGLDAWKKSFQMTNLHPMHRVPFPEWCKKIESFLRKVSLLLHPLEMLLLLSNFVVLLANTWSEQHSPESVASALHQCSKL